ncbi:hypothetical protein ABFX02_13G140700 [Erythranthe guttata]
MALKFLNKKGWHTGSLRNIENVWKAEQKRDAEDKKLEELKKQIHEERGRAEFRQLQIDSGLIPKQERLEFLYDSGLAVGKGSSNFKALEPVPKTEPDTTASASASTSEKPQSAAPGALFEEKPQTANDAWRKLHSDPLLLIRQREQESLARVKNNPVQMAMIRKSVEATKGKDKDDNSKHGKKHHRNKSKHRKHSSSENDSDSNDAGPTLEKGRRESHHKGSKTDKPSSKKAYTSDEEPPSQEDARRKKHHDREYKDKNEDQHRSKHSYYNSRREEYSSERQIESRHDYRHDNKRSHLDSSDKPPRNEPSKNRHRNPVKLSEEERAARLREMEMDAETHEQQRWKRIKKAADSDAHEANRDHASLGRNFLDDAQKSIYGAEKGGSSTIEESVRRRSHYLQRRQPTDSNAFRRS